MGFFHKKDVDKAQEESTNINMNISEETEPENWVWVDGYKCTDKNMRGYNNFQYELNKQFNCDGKIKVGCNGFHFCKNIKDLCYFGNVMSGRMFKVKALCNTNDKDSINQCCDLYQYAAKSIVLVEELDTKAIWNLCSEQLLKPYSMNCNGIEYNIKDVNSYNDFIKIREIGIDKFRYNNLFSKYKELGFSDTFITVYLLEDFMNVHNDFWRVVYSNNYYEKAKALVQEGLSKDMIVYFLLKYKNSK